MASIASLVAARRRATSLLLRHLTLRNPKATAASSFLSSTAALEEYDGQSRREWGDADGRGTSRPGGGEGKGEGTADRGWVAATAAGLALAFGAPTGDTKDTAKNCGIVGVVSSSEKGSAVDPVDFLFEGLSILRNRGYDSAGVATVDADKEMVVSKFASRDDVADSMELLKTNKTNHNHHTVGIAHTRWATHGELNAKRAKGVELQERLFSLGSVTSPAAKGIQKQEDKRRTSGRQGDAGGSGAGSSSSVAGSSSPKKSPKSAKVLKTPKDKKTSGKGTAGVGAAGTGTRGAAAAGAAATGGSRSSKKDSARKESAKKKKTR